MASVQGAAGNDVARCLARMAGRSTRAQADLGAAARCAGLVLDEAGISALAADLLLAGVVSDPIPLTDGGILVTVPAEVIAALTSAQAQAGAERRTASARRPRKRRPPRD